MVTGLAFYTHLNWFLVYGLPDWLLLARLGSISIWINSIDLTPDVTDLVFDLTINLTIGLFLDVHLNLLGLGYYLSLDLTWLDLLIIRLALGWPDL